MPLLKEFEIVRLEKAIGNLLRGMPVGKWADQVTHHLLMESGSTTPKVELSTSLLNLRKIEAVRDDNSKGKLTDWGRLSIGSTGFIIEIPSVLKRQAYWYRFSLAHEIGHTFFYDLSQWPPVRRTFLFPGSKDLEWVCDLLASRLLVPTSRLKSEAEKYSPPESLEFSLSCFKHLERTFDAHWRIIAQRLNEEEIWRGITLQLRAYHRPPIKTGYRRKSDYEWYLEWYSAPRDLLDDLGIAFVFRSTNGSLKFRRVWGDLNKLLDRWREQATPVKEIKEEVPLNFFRIGKLFNILDATYNSTTRTVFAAVKNFPESSTGGSKRSSKLAASVVLFIPMNKHS